MPTSMTVAPGLSQSPLIIFGRPMAATTMSAWRVNAGQVAGARVDDGHGAAFAEQELRHRLADDVRAADDHGVQAGEVAELGLQQLQAAERRARDEAGEADGEPAGVDRVEAVDVLVGIDGEDDRVGVDMRRQRQLDEDPVDRGVGVEAVDQGEQLGLRSCRREACARSSPSRPRRVALPL